LETEIIFDELYTKHVLAPGHPESPDRLTYALDSIRGAGILDNKKVAVVSPEAARIDSVTPLHDQAYLRLVQEKSEKGGGFFTLDTSVNKYTYDAAMLAAGGGIVATDNVMAGKTRNAFLLCRPPGHHAERNRAFGFCFINNIAVAAQHLVSAHGIKRILIIDYDAHHGNGTQNAFYDRSDVLYVGLHQDGRTLFPGSGFPNELGKGDGMGFNVNLAMYPGAGDKSYEMVFEDLIGPIAESYKPEFVLVSAGFDGHFDDPLTDLGLTTSGFAMMNSRIREIAAKFSGNRLVYFLEGGYNLDVMSSASLVLVEELSGNSISEFKDRHSESQSCTNYTVDLIGMLRESLEGIHL
jgi:acetoin utilization deacetylase AcuC-like enzyme